MPKPIRPFHRAVRRLALLMPLLALSSTWAHSWDDGREDGWRTGRDLILVNPGDLFSGVLSLEFEHAVAPFFGLTLGVSLWTFRSVFSPRSDPWVTMFSPEVGARFHFVRDAPGGLWVGPYVSGGYVISRSDGEVSPAWTWGLGAALGYNFIIGRFFTIQVGGGGGFTDYGARLVWMPRLRLGLGVAF